MQSTKQTNTPKKPSPYIQAIRDLQSQAHGLVKDYGEELETAIPGVTTKLGSNHPENILEGLELAAGWIETHLPDFQVVTLPEPRGAKTHTSKRHTSKPRGKRDDTAQLRDHVKQLLWNANQMLGGDFRQQVRDLTPGHMRDIIDLGEDGIIAQGKVKKLEAAVKEMSRFQEMARTAYEKHNRR